MKKKRLSFGRKSNGRSYASRIANMSSEQLCQLRARNAENQRNRRARRTQQQIDDQRKRDAQAVRKRRERLKNNPQTNADINKTVNNFVYACFWPKCERTFSSNYSLLCHLRSDHKKPNDSASARDVNGVSIKLKKTISGEFGNDFNIDTMAKERRERIHECDKCGEKFETVGHLNDHTIMHIDKPFKCDFCDQPYDTINELLDHRDVIHFNKKLIQCDKCSYRAKGETNLRIHQRRVHQKEKNFICTESACNGKAFFSIHDLRSHRTRFHSTERYVCIWPGCCRSFKSVDYLDKHLKWHSGDSEYRCDYPECYGKLFSSTTALNTHRQCVHSDAKPFACDWPGCGASFKIKSFLNIHVNGVHNKPNGNVANERKFKCANCDYTATNKQAIYMHGRRVHEKLRKFSCDASQCNGKSFCSKRELDDHKNSVHSDKRPFVCDWPQCKSAFKLKNNLKIHIKKVHTRI